MNSQPVESPVAVGLHRAGGNAEIDSHAVISPASQQPFADFAFPFGQALQGIHHPERFVGLCCPGQAEVQTHTGKQGVAQAAKHVDIGVAKGRLAIVSIEVDRQQTPVFPQANQRSTLTQAVAGVDAAAMLFRNFLRMAVRDRRFAAFQPLLCRIEGLIGQVNPLAIEMKCLRRPVRRLQTRTPVK